MRSVVVLVGIVLLGMLSESSFCMQTTSPNKAVIQVDIAAIDSLDSFHVALEVIKENIVSITKNKELVHFNKVIAFEQELINILNIFNVVCGEGCNKCFDCQQLDHIQPICEYALLLYMLAFQEIVDYGKAQSIMVNSSLWYSKEKKEQVYKAVEVMLGGELFFDVYEKFEQMKAYEDISLGIDKN